jgi:hypothetical protein
MGHYLDSGLEHEKWDRVESSEDAAQLLLRDARQVFQDNGPRYSECRAYASVHEGLELTSFELSGYQFDNRDVWGDALDAPILKNTIRSTVMTLVAKLTANDTPLAQFMTNRGGWKESVKAVRMGRLVDAEVEQPQGNFATLHEMHRHGATIAIGVTGSYMIFFFPGDEGIRCELDDTLAVGIETSGRFGRITRLVRTVWRDADELAADFPDHEDEIYAAEDTCMDGSVAQADQSHENVLRPRRGVRVVQGWKLAYKGQVGREMWVLEKDGTILRDRDYDRKTGPWVKWDFERSLYGVWGTPVSRTIYEMAMRENRMLCDMDNAERNSPQCLLILPENAEKEGDLDEARGWQIIRSNVPATQFNFATPPKYNQMSADFVDRLSVYCQDMSGVQEQHSAAKGVPGTTSGKHEQLRAGLFTERYADQERRLIQARAIDSAKRIVETLEELLEESPGFSRVWARGDKTEEIKASDLDLDVSKYTITVAATSEDKDSPRARAEKAYEMLQQGLITSADYASLLETFAVHEESAIITAQKAWVEKQIDKWLHSSQEARQDENFYQGPTEWLDLPSAMRQVSLAHLQARTREAPADILEYFDKFLAECSDFMDEDSAQAATSISTDAAGAATIFPGLSDQTAAAPAPAPVGAQPLG